MENVSVNSNRAGFQTPGSCGSATVSQGTAGDVDVDSAIYPCYAHSGDEISLKSMPGVVSQHPRSLSPVTSMSGEELSAAIRRSRRRQGFFDKQLSCESQDIAGDSTDQAALDRVRFDDNVSLVLDDSKLSNNALSILTALSNFKQIGTLYICFCNVKFNNDLLA